MEAVFPLKKMLQRIEAAVKSFPKAAMFVLADEGYTGLFEQLVACIISIRTRDETTIPLSRSLLQTARSPQEVLALPDETLLDLLHGTTFPEQKVRTIKAVAAAALQYPDHKLPADFVSLTGIKGVGPKCANLALGIAAGQARISVDVHVHRVVNRWGWISARTPEQTLMLLEQKVPESLRIDINRLLMPFGKHICTGTLPHCSTCPVAEYCKRVGVKGHR